MILIIYCLIVNRADECFEGDKDKKAKKDGTHQIKAGDVSERSHNSATIGEADEEQLAVIAII